MGALIETYIYFGTAVFMYLEVNTHEKGIIFFSFFEEEDEVGLLIAKWAFMYLFLGRKMETFPFYSFNFQYLYFVDCCSQYKC